MRFGAKIVAACSLLAFACGCSRSGDSIPTGIADAGEDGVAQRHSVTEGATDAAILVLDGEREAFDLRVPAEVIDAHARAWNTRDLSLYKSLLAEDFEFDPPWGPSWARSAEVGMMTNMFDPSFQGSVEALESIDVAIDISSIQPGDQGEIVVMTSFQGIFMTGPLDGFAPHTMLRFRLVPRDGSLRIREIKEIMLSRVVPTPLASIKLMYE